MSDLVYQVYKKQFGYLHDVNTFLLQFPKGELEPITIDERYKAVIVVWFKTSTVWSKQDLDTYGLKDA